MSELPHLLVEVQFHGGFYHGQPEWPPSPARLFQALLAGVARGRTLDERSQRALERLEEAPAPVVGAPLARRGKPRAMYMPNNDLDAEGGDPARVEKIRAKKVYRPRIFDASVPIAYLWRLSTSPDDTGALTELAQHLHQLGRGIDPAWARASWLGDAARAEYEARYPGRWYRPTDGAEAGERLLVPTRGTTQSLLVRFSASEERLSVEGKGRSAYWAFRQPPKPVLQTVAYDGGPSRRLFELVPLGTEGEAPGRRLFARAMTETVALVEQMRDSVRDRLVAVFPERAAEIDAHVVGRSEVPVGQAGRVRVVPLPSIGHPHADPDIRRILVEVPAGFGALGVEDVHWAFSGLELANTAHLVPATNDAMLRHYGVGTTHRAWETVTPAALPIARRRLDPEALADQRDRYPHARKVAKHAKERIAEERAAVASVRDALRHAGVDGRAVEVTVQREPFRPRGERAEAFEHRPRFSKHALWHVRLRLDRAVAGPLVIGDGRFLGLGIMRPAEEVVLDHIGFEIRDGLAASAAGEDLGRAFRRAMLALAGREWGERSIPSEVSGHDEEGRPSRDHRHVRIAVSGARLVVFPPSGDRATARIFGRLQGALRGMTELMAGRLGSLALTPVRLLPSDPLLRRHTTWESATPYLVCRHRASGATETAIRRDVEAECLREGLPRPEVEVLERWARRGRGLEARLRLRFAHPVGGPILLGRNHHVGGGTFIAR